MIAVVIIVIDEPFNLGFQIPWHVIVLEQDAVLHGLMPAFDLALGLRMIRSTPDMLHIFFLQPFGQT